MNLKVMPLDMWMSVSWIRRDTIELGNYVPMKPVFNRSGIYRWGLLAWFELEGPGGGAWELPSVDQFSYSLSLLDVLEVPENVCAALRAVVRAGAATADQRRFVGLRDDAMMCRDTRRSARIASNRAGL